MAAHYTTAKGAIASKPSGAYKNDTGTIKHAGTPSSRWNADNNLGYNDTKASTRIPTPETKATIAGGTNTKATFKPYSSGTFAYSNASKFIMMRQSDTISGVSNTALLTGANDGFKKSANRTKDSYDSVVYTGWDWVTGKPDTAVNYTRPYKSIDGVTTQVDHAANPTRAIPGELTILETGATPTNKDYSAKNT